ncbi:BON domain-containing protein [Singulisphaera sp. Ch08]|uniref:BON domain-containing protein n=1 Tax=Singulisphaera sp. Ch08 TaxID=3120278 RepID=A0AAU7CCT5_9BACT
MASPSRGGQGVCTVTVSLSPLPDRELPAAPRACLEASFGREVERRLRGSGYLALRGLSCELHAGIARLRGRVPTYYLKQVAQAIVSEIDGVRQVINQIEIVAPAGRSPLGREIEEAWGESGAIGFQRKRSLCERPSPCTHPEGTPCSFTRNKRE